MSDLEMSGLTIITPNPAYRCPVCNATDTGEGVLNLSLDGKTTWKHCGKCYVNWLRRNVPELVPITEGE